MRTKLFAQILLLAFLALALLVGEFVVVVGTFNSIRDHTRAEQRSESVVVAAVQVETLILDLEIGARGYVITRDPKFLQPWRAAQQELPKQSVVLMADAPGPATKRIDTLWRAYLAHWSKPIVQQVRLNPGSARIRLASGEGKQRIDVLRRALGSVVAEHQRRAAADRAQVARAEHRGIVFGFIRIGLTVIVFFAIIAYFLRTVVLPLRKISRAAGSVGEGALGVEVPEEGAGEVRQLAVAFNEMSRSLAEHRGSLAAQNSDLERLAGVLQAVLDSTIDGILLSDADGEVQLANRPMVEMSRDIGMSFDGLVVDRLLTIEDRIADPAAYRAAMERLRENSDESTFDEFEDVPTGRVFQGFTAPVRDDSGRFLGRVWTLRDVSQQRELDRLKDEFVATVSHELRTPLTSMMGFLEMIREGEAGETTAEQKRFLAIVYRSSERLQRLVGDLLFVARLDANGLQLQFADVDLVAVVREAVESVAPLARSRTLELQAELQPAPPVTGDAERLMQLVGNLISNALKFTPQGGRVTVRTFTEERSAVIEVEDTGIGIPAGEQSRLFQRFFRSSSATEQAIPGTGLGLVISRAIAEAHGGRISVDLKPGVGTCFRVELPLEPDEVAL
ncbi:MAG TPA: ATP-binding protein [Gaiellaceae bacterium]